MIEIGAIDFAGVSDELKSYITSTIANSNQGRVVYLCKCLGLGCFQDFYDVTTASADRFVEIARPFAIQFDGEAVFCNEISTLMKGLWVQAEARALRVKIRPSSSFQETRCTAPPSLSSRFRLAKFGSNSPSVSRGSPTPTQSIVSDVESYQNDIAMSQDSVGDSQPTKSYIPRIIYMEGKEGGRPRKKTNDKGSKLRLPPIDERELEYDLLLFTTHLFAGASEIIDDFTAHGFPDGAVREFLIDAFSGRCKTASSINRILGFVFHYIEYSKLTVPHSPFVGKGCVITITGWLKALRGRGHTVPNAGKHALGVANDVLRLNLPLNYPAVKNAARPDTRAVIKHAPIAPFELMLGMGEIANNRLTPEGLRLYAAIFSLMSLASLRFSDLREVLDFWVSDSAVCGRSVDQKDKHGALMTWATPALGLSGSTEWTLPILSFWNNRTAKKADGAFIPLFPAVSKDWCILPMAGTSGGVQPCLARVELFMGREPLLKLHSFRTFIPTCAGQLQLDMDKRRKLGRWSATSTMPDRYDRAVCASELATRSKVLDEIAHGWRPAADFEIPVLPGAAKRKGRNNENETEDSVATDSSETSSVSEEVDISKLYE